MNAERLGIGRDNARCVIATAPCAKKGATVPDAKTPPGSPRVDLRSAASGAAIELDNISLGRRFKTTTIQQLLQLLMSDIPSDVQTSSPMSLITPTVMVMDRVVRNRQKEASPRLEAVVRDLQAIVAGLQKVASEPNRVRETDPELINKLRSDCLDISRFAASLRRPTATAPRNTPRS